jgi:hypothetical protein
MRRDAFRILAIVAVILCFDKIALAAGWSRGVTVTSLGENNVVGEVVQFTVDQEIDNSGRCPVPTGYAIRDSATLKGSLALLTSAMVTGRKVDLYVTGTCDASGMPSVLGVILH